MPAKTKKKKVAKKNKRAVKAKILISAGDLGVEREHVLCAAKFPIQDFRASESEAQLARELSRNRIFHQPLTSHRVAFWLGAGLGILVTGTLALLIWQLVRIDLFEAVVAGLVR